VNCKVKSYFLTEKVRYFSKIKGRRRKVQKQKAVSTEMQKQKAKRSSRLLIQSVAGLLELILSKQVPAQPALLHPLPPLKATVLLKQLLSALQSLKGFRKLRTITLAELRKPCLQIMHFLHKKLYTEENSRSKKVQLWLLFLK
jgi:hypothetical protein